MFLTTTTTRFLYFCFSCIINFSFTIRASSHPFHKLRPVNTRPTTTSFTIYGCTDPTASNYWCDIDGNDCTGGIPVNVRDGGCEYKQKIPLVYNYAFCNDSKGCDKINLDAGTHNITTLNKKSVKKMYNDYKGRC